MWGGGGGGGGRSRLVITGFCGIFSSTMGSTVEALLSRVPKCSLHLALMLLFSFSTVQPSDDGSGVMRDLVGPETSVISLKNFFEVVFFW